MLPLDTGPRPVPSNSKPTASKGADRRIIPYPGRVCRSTSSNFALSSRARRAVETSADVLIGALMARDIVRLGKVVRESGAKAD
jgi:hypothetical protein